METAPQNGPGGVNGSAGVSKAERFEDEKRRIVDSCFNKKDEDGSCKIAERGAAGCKLMILANCFSRSNRIVHYPYQDR